MKDSREKGSLGYLKFRKKKNLCWTFFLFSLAAVALVFGLWLYNGDKNNFFTLLAALLSLPAAKWLVAFLLFFPYPFVKEEQYQRVLAVKHEQDVLFTEVLMTSKEKPMYFSFFVYTGQAVIGLLGREKESEEFCKEYFSNLFLRCGYSVKVKITKEETIFIKKIQSEKRKNVFTENEKKEQEEVIALLRSMMA